MPPREEMRRTLLTHPGTLLSLPSHGDMARGKQTPAEPILSLPDTRLAPVV